MTMADIDIIPVKLPLIFPRAPLEVNGALRNIQVNLIGMTYGITHNGWREIT